MTFEEYWNKYSCGIKDLGPSQLARIAWEAGAEANGAKTMKADCKDYIRRLISGIREEMEKDPDMIRARANHREKAIIRRWFDVELLCYVIEKEVLGDNKE